MSAKRPKCDRHDMTRYDRGRRQKLMQEQPHRLIVPDEKGTSTRMTREYGRSLRDERLSGSAPFRRWGNQTLIAGPDCGTVMGRHRGTLCDLWG